ncbi:uncharacterized protein IL334_007338 [Kwoniella shivajii]|uniref:Uncharacterized protein n=1 Tax=Kwoniella shivajii TaxID=564305 RepID=A0ABZ1DAI8_9TREE|nr:hypothetical protein IL334_007338 [Kwoniella shivajii]
MDKISDTHTTPVELSLRSLGKRFGSKTPDFFIESIKPKSDDSVGKYTEQSISEFGKEVRQTTFTLNKAAINGVHGLKWVSKEQPAALQHFQVDFDPSTFGTVQNIGNIQRGPVSGNFRETLLVPTDSTQSSAVIETTVESRKFDQDRNTVVTFGPIQSIFTDRSQQPQDPKFLTQELSGKEFGFPDRQAGYAHRLTPYSEPDGSAYQFFVDSKLISEVGSINSEAALVRGSILWYPKPSSESVAECHTSQGTQTVSQYTPEASDTEASDTEASDTEASNTGGEFSENSVWHKKWRHMFH